MDIIIITMTQIILGIIILGFVCYIGIVAFLFYRFRNITKNIENTFNQK